MANKSKCVVLLSGGLDSATILAIAVDAGFEACALTVRYGQRHTAEIDAAGRVAAHLKAARHLVATVDLGKFGGSALTDAIEVPKGRSDEDRSTGVPVTYVPARNTVLLSMALAWAETLGSSDIFIGVNAVDYSGYPDCRPPFLEAFQNLANLATKAGTEGGTRFRVHAPLLEMSKAEIIRRGQGLGVDYGMTLTCYDPVDGNAACGQCDACLLRLRGFAEAGITDPVRYHAPSGARK